MCLLVVDLELFIRRKRQLLMRRQRTPHCSNAGSHGRLFVQVDNLDIDRVVGGGGRAGVV